MNVLVNGEQKQVTLSEAISGTQYRAANDQKAQQLARKEGLRHRRQTAAEEFDTRLQQIQGLGQMLEQQLLAEYTVPVDGSTSRSQILLRM